MSFGRRSHSKGSDDGHAQYKQPNHIPPAFRLNGVDGLQPAGSYTLTVEEEKLDTLSVDAWRRTSATLCVPQGGAIDYAAISMEDLQAALARDAAPDHGTSAPPPRIEPSMSRKREFLHAGQSVMTHADDRDAFHFGRIHAEGWKAARSLLKMSDSAAEIRTLNPFRSGLERAKRSEGFAQASQ
ncbi:MAG TPA: hypothetical protein VN723_07290 [Rhizomicrobium sp.]|jgi:hypothetical protein|nr:hypothetical protein [Rhizomicrobium sp.]